MADYEYVTPTGTIVPDTADLRAAVEAEFRAALGADLVVTPDTPQGVLITAEVLARSHVVDNNAALANQINPNLAGGVFLDAIWALTGGERVRATPSLIVGVQLAGTPGATVGEGAQARVGSSGPIFQLISAVLLDSFGQGVGTFQSLELGPVAAGVGALNTIVTTVLGWETVTNPGAAQPGVAEETDQASRLRRRRTLSLQNVALPEAIVSALYDQDQTPGVRSVLYRENYTKTDIVIDGVTLLANSILAVVQGATDLAVATTLLANKSLGCGWNGTTTVAVVEPVSGQSYDVKFRRPTAVPIYMQVTVRQGSFVGDPEQAVKDAILAYADGSVVGEEGFTIGADVSPFELAGAVAAAVPGIYVQNFGISLTPSAYAATQLVMTIVQQATVVPGAINVVVV